MSKLSEVFSQKKPLITYLTAGDPNLKRTKKLIHYFSRVGADIIELGLPFSDPLADGPTIQASHARALESGTTLPKIMEMIKSFKNRLKVPLILMGAANLYLAYGLKQFFEDAERYGVSGLIIPDLPPEESRDFLYLAQQHKIDLIFLAAVTSSEYRLKLITQVSTSFIYLISSEGLTGERSQLDYSKIEKVISNIKKIKNIPVAVGFGISDAEQAREVLKFADGIIIGSAIVTQIERSAYQAIRFVKQLARRIKQK